MVSLQAFQKYSQNVPTHIISAKKILLYYFIRSEQLVPDSLELKTCVPEHVVPHIIELQSGVRQTVYNGIPSIYLDMGMLTGVESMNTDPSVCL